MNRTTNNTTYRHPLGNGCLVSLQLTSNTTVSPKDTISSPTLNISTPLNIQPSGLLNSPSAFSSHPHSRSTATIPPSRIQSFATDSLQTWPPQSQSPRHHQPSPRTTNLSYENSDFVLFPTTATDSRPLTPQARRHSERVQATSRTIPNQSQRSTYYGQQYRQNSTHQPESVSVSPAQNPRVSRVVHGTGSPSTSPSIQYSPYNGQQSNFYANSAPSSTASLHQQDARVRPQVPLFYNSTGSTPQTNMAHQDHFEGISPPKESKGHSSDLTSSPDGMFDFNAFPSGTESATDGLFNSSLEFSSDYNGINIPEATLSPDAPTVSPSDLDLVVDSISAPPSGAFTDLPTPATSILESPYVANSANPSPLFTDNLSLDDDPDQWAPLFNDVEERAAKVPASPYTSYVAPKMSRNDSSPGQSSTRSSNQGRHSFTAGVAPKRRNVPLPPIVVEDKNDIVAVKRARNTLAARKSREKRVERSDALSKRVNELEEEVEQWKGIALSLGYIE